MTYLRKQVIQDGRIVYQDFGDSQSSGLPTIQSSNKSNYPAYNDYSDYQQAPSSFPPPVHQSPAPPPAVQNNPVQPKTDITIHPIYVHPFVWLFGIIVFAVMMTGLLRPTVIMPYGGGGTTNNFVMPGAGGQ